MFRLLKSQPISVRTSQIHEIYSRNSEWPATWHRPRSQARKTKSFALHIYHTNPSNLSRHPDLVNAAFCEKGICRSDT